MREALDERQRRLLVAVEAEVLGRGGISAVSAATGVSRTTIMAGLTELEAMQASDGPVEQAARWTTSTRRSGGGRKKIETQDETLCRIFWLSWIQSPKATLSHPCAGLARACEIWLMNSKPSGHTLGRANSLKLKTTAYKPMSRSLKATKIPTVTPQFEHINATVTAALQAIQPVISVDTKKKELVGEYKNAGQAWLLSGEPVKVKIHDFIDKELGRANPYGVYDIGADEAWVSVGTDHDTGRHTPYKQSGDGGSVWAYSAIQRPND